MATNAELLTELSTRVEGLAKSQEGMGDDLRELKAKVDRLLKVVVGENGTPGHGEQIREQDKRISDLEKTQQDIADNVKEISKYLLRSIIGFFGAIILVGITAAVNVYAPLMTHVEYTPVAIVVTATPTHTRTPTATPKPTRTPTPKRTPTPTIIPRTYAEIEAATALCWVECRGMEEMRSTCCASVLDTVHTRIEEDKMTDGTFIGTLRYGCEPDTINCQFPAYVTRGCDGISSACPFDDEMGLNFFRRLVRLYWEDTLEPWCSNFLFYDLGLDEAECEIRADNGQFLIFHGKVEEVEEDE